MAKASTQASASRPVKGYRSASRASGFTFNPASIRRVRRNEKRQISDALAHVDAQREKLSGQLSELAATERVLAFYVGPLKACICAKATGSKKAVGEAYTETGCPSRIEIRCRE